MLCDVYDFSESLISVELIVILLKKSVSDSTILKEKCNKKKLKKTEEVIHHTGTTHILWLSLTTQVSKVCH